MDSVLRYRSAKLTVEEFVHSDEQVRILCEDIRVLECDLGVRIGHFERHRPRLKDIGHEHDDKQDRRGNQIVGALCIKG